MFQKGVLSTLDHQSPPIELLTQSVYYLQYREISHACFYFNTVYTRYYVSALASFIIIWKDRIRSIHQACQGSGATRGK